MTTARLAGGGTLVVTGVLLFVVAWRDRPAHATRDELVPPVACQQSKAEFTAHLREVGSWSRADFGNALTLAASAAALRVRDVRITCETTRVLRNGSEYDAEFVLQYFATERRVALEVRSPRQAAYSAQLRDDGAVEVGLETDGGWTTLPTGAVPLGLCDAAMSDLLGAWTAVERSAPRWLGVLDKAGTRDLLVFEVAGPELPNSALVYLDAADWSLRAVRVFDGNDCLVRVYDGFVRDLDGGPSAFRVTSLPDRSHSVFRVELQFP